jgi:hypothetical protein
LCFFSILLSASIFGRWKSARLIWAIAYLDGYRWFSLSICLECRSWNELRGRNFEWGRNLGPLTWGWVNSQGTRRPRWQCSAVGVVSGGGKTGWHGCHGGSAGVPGGTVGTPVDAHWGMHLPYFPLGSTTALICGPPALAHLLPCTPWSSPATATNFENFKIDVR